VALFKYNAPMQKRHIISAVFVVAIILTGLFYAAFERGVISYRDGALKFSKSAITNPAPSLHRKTVFPVDFSEETKGLYMARLEKTTSALESDLFNYEAWLDLAIAYRMVGDNAGAIEIWEYLSASDPRDGISRHNLAEHYFHTEKQYEKAEKLYRESIAVAPALGSNYTDLYDMYRYVYKQNTGAAVDILLEGVETLGGTSAIQFNIMLGRHYRDVLKDATNARKYLTEARDAAAARGDRAIATQLSAEISSL
jgi:tetratricopeptide (TPR) repeat protein